MFKVFRDPDLQQAFDRDGYAVVDLIGRGECEQLLDFWRAIPSDLETMSFSNTMMSRDLGYRRTVHERVLATLGPAIDKLLDRYRTCLCSFNVKSPKDGRGIVEWHQDWSFVDESRGQSVGVWCPLMDVDSQNGCLRVVPGSHRLNNRMRPFASNFPYSYLVDRIESDYARFIPMKAGQAVVYRQALFHSSPPNESSTVRVAAGALAIPLNVPLLFVARGEDDRAGRLVLRRVPDDFYVRHLYGTEPDSGSEVGTTEADCEPLSEDRLWVILGGKDDGIQC